MNQVHDGQLLLSRKADRIRIVWMGLPHTAAVKDGMIDDKNGNLYLGDYQHYKLVRLTPAHKLDDVVSDDRLIWPDSYAISTDDYLYISCSQINKQPDYKEGENKRTSPYAIYRMKLPVT